MDVEQDQDPIAQAFAKANQINARLSSQYDSALASEGRRVADQLLNHVREKVEDYDDFVARAERSEEFPLHDSAQLKKDEVRLKGIYLRATGLLETIQDAEARKR